MKRAQEHSRQQHHHDNDGGDDHDSEIEAEDANGAKSGAAVSRLLVTNEGRLDPSLLLRTEGFMHKKGGAVNARGGFRNWKKRWFVLAPVDFLGVAQGYELQYYDAPNGNLKGKVGLSEVELFCEERSAARNKKVKYEFQVVLQNGGVLQLSCDDAAERDEWIETLNMVIAFLRKVLTSASMTLDGYDPLFEDDADSHRIGAEIAQSCQAYGAGLFGAEAGQPAQFVVQVHDLLGQQVTRGGMPVTANISGGGCLYHLRVVDQEDGSYFAQYTLGRQGRYQLSVLLNDEHHIFGSPFEIEILPSRTAAQFCSAEGDALQRIELPPPPPQQHLYAGMSGSSAPIVTSFTITAKDSFGNRKTRGGDPFEVGIMGSAAAAAAAATSNPSSTSSGVGAGAPAGCQLRSLTDMGDGTYVCEVEASATTTWAGGMGGTGAASLVPPQTQSLLLLVTLHGKHITGSPFKPTLSCLGAEEHDMRYLQQETREHQYPQRAGEKQAPPYAYSAPEPVTDTGLALGVSSERFGEGTRHRRGDCEIEVESSVASGVSVSPSPRHATTTLASPEDSGRRGGAGKSNDKDRGIGKAPASAARGQPPLSPLSPDPANPRPSPSPVTPTPQQQQQTVAGGAMSRLERSRQRALMAKALAEGGPASTGAATAATAPPIVATAASHQQLQHEQQKSEGQRQGQGHRGQLKLSQVATRGASNLSALRHKQQVRASMNIGEASPPPAGAATEAAAADIMDSPHGEQAVVGAAVLNPELLGAVAAGLRLGLGGFSATAEPGIRTEGAENEASQLGPPSNATPNECKIWDNVHRAFSNENVLKLLCSQLQVLQALFRLFAQRVEGVTVIKLVTSSSSSSTTPSPSATAEGGGGGVYRLLEAYDVLPTYLSRVEVKVLFALASHAQRNLRLPAAQAGGGVGLDFVTFLKFLVLLAYHALSKTNAYSSLYNTIESKVEVMLFKWGLAESIKLQVVQQQQQQQPHQTL